MKIFIKVKTNSKINSVERVGRNNYILRVNAPAREGKANGAVMELLSEYLNIPKSRISILKGLTSKNKIISIR